MAAIRPAPSSSATTQLRYSSSDVNDVDTVESMKAEIEALRKRARERLEEVSHKAEEVLADAPPDPASIGEGAARALEEEKRILGLDGGGGGGRPRTAAARKRATKATVKENTFVPPSGEEDDAEEKVGSEGEGERHPVERAPTYAHVEKTKIEGGSEDYVGKKIDVSPGTVLHAGNAPLENTYWKIMLNIGREPGTWMPKTWGVSGERLLLQLQVQFRPDPLDEREDFLGGSGADGGKGSLCHVVQNDAVFGPSMTESARHVRFLDGGWRIGRGEGPLGTDVLRFYVDLEEKVERGDVYCPAGRVYCTCGYFDVSHRGHSRKVDARRKLDGLADKYNNILDEMKEEDLFSLKRMSLWKDQMKCQADIDQTNRVMNDLKVMEPDLNLLRLSRKRDIGLTREGGVCCKVQKGPAGFYEYHILGRFEAASVEHGNDRVE